MCYTQETVAGAMASSHTDLEGNLKCSICYDIFKDPVVLFCSHSFCKECLNKTWNKGLDRQCPLCRQVTKSGPFKCLALKDVCESLVKQKRPRISTENQGVFCHVHRLKYEFFCLNDQKLLCWSCVTQDHKKHNFCTINKAAEEHRNKLQNPLEELEKKLQTLISKNSTFTNIFTNLQSQGQQTETQIKDLFKKLQQSLKDEEKNRLTALRNELKRKKDTITEKITEVEQSKTSLSKRIKTIKDDLGCDEILFLHNFINIQERVNITLQDPQLDSGSEIDVAKHMGNLRYSVWESIKKSCPYYPVILDPNSKTPSIEVSSDLTSMVCTGGDLLNSPDKRFCCILGSEGFSSGVHTWQVDVETCEHWALGVVNESAKQLQNLSSCPILISRINGTCSWSPLAPKIKKVCVCLDLEEAKVIFSDPDTNVRLQSYNVKSIEKMYPCFFPLSHTPLKILALQQRPL